MSSHCARASGSEMRTFRKSAGMLCTASGEIAFLVTDFILTALCNQVLLVLTWTFARQSDLGLHLITNGQ